MKFLYLDFDGVLNSVGQSVALNALGDKPYGVVTLSREAIGLLKWVCETTNASIIISSSWRIGKSLAWFEGIFEAYGWVNPPIYGVTPLLPNGIRGDEVKEFHEYQEFLFGEKIKYVIIDDDTDFHTDQPLVRSNAAYGLTLKEAIMMVDILGVNDHEKMKEVNELRAHTECPMKMATPERDI